MDTTIYEKKNANIHKKEKCVLIMMTYNLLEYKIMIYRYINLIYLNGMTGNMCEFLLLYRYVNLIYLNGSILFNKK